MRQLHCPECQRELPFDPDRPPAVTICPACSKPIRLAPLPPDEAEPPPRVPPTLPRFDAEPYHPDGGFSVARLPILLGALLVVAVALGWLSSFIGQWFYLVLIYPMAVGAGLAVTGLWAGRVAQMRNPLLGGLIGLLSAAVAITAMHYFDYQRHIKKATAEVLAIPHAGPRLTPAEVETILREAVSFGRFMNLQAEAGVRIGSDNGLNLGFVGSWIYWAAELLVVACMASAGVYRSTREPFCRECSSWKTTRTIGVLPETADLIEAMRTGDLTRAAADAAKPGVGILLLNAAVCPQCDTRSPLAVKLERVVKDNENNVKKEEVLHVTYPGEALPSLEAVVLPPGNE